MILPHGNTNLLLLMVLCMLCWGSWPILYKLANRYRFELFYFDFAFGVMVAALVCAFTFGSFGFDGFGLTDDFMNARRQDWVYAFVAAMIFNFGNMTMMASVTVSGIAVAFPLAFGAAMIVSAWMNYLLHPAATAMILLGGTVLVLGSLILDASAYSRRTILQHETQARAGKAKSTRRPSSFKGIILALVGGMAMGSFAPLLGRAQDPDTGLGPFSLLVLFAAGIAVSTFIFNLFFMNLPVEGDPLEISEYFRGRIRNHFLGFMSGAIWATGAAASFVVASPKGLDHLSPPLDTLLRGLAPLIVALWGILVWKEFQGGGARAKAFAALALLFFAGGVVVFSCAPLWATTP